MKDPAGRVLVIIPTYNERENLDIAVAGLREHVPHADVLVVDDGSPDGTGEIADAMAAATAGQTGGAVHVLHRSGKQGLGKAYLAGFAWGIEQGYDTLVEMDADGSHRAADLPAVLAGLDGADLVIGSRWVPGGSVQNWPLSRMILSRGANTYTRLAMGLPVKDATAGFRAYRATLLADLGLDDVASAGYCFQVDMTWRVAARGGRIREVPITFVERVRGESKMSSGIVVEALGRVTLWGLQARAQQISRLVRR